MSRTLDEVAQDRLHISNGFDQFVSDQGQFN